MNKPLIEVAAALIKKNGKFLLCLRKPDDHYGDLWEFPGGKIEAGETAQAAIVREMKEELGIDVRAVDLAGEFYDEDDALIIKVFLVCCDIVGGEPQALDCQDWGFFSSQEIKKLALAPADKKICKKIL